MSFKVVWATTGVLVAMLAVAPAGGSQKGAALPTSTVKVFKQSACGCCDAWVEHMKRSGFQVSSENVADLEAIKGRYQVPVPLRTCHTAVVGGYVVEGHVPADVIVKLLRERPNVVGIGVAGMPNGSPGMESPTPEPYDVLAFRKGYTTVFARR